MQLSASLLADEPTGNLDSKASDEIAELLRQVADEWGRAVVMMTHAPRIAAYADRILRASVKDDAIADETRPDAGAQNVGNAGLAADKMKMIG